MTDSLKISPQLDSKVAHDPGGSRATLHPGGNPGANLKPISHRCHPMLVTFVWELTQEITYLPLGCLQGDV